MRFTFFNAFINNKCLTIKFLQSLQNLNTICLQQLHKKSVFKKVSRFCAFTPKQRGHVGHMMQSFHSLFGEQLDPKKIIAGAIQEKSDESSAIPSVKQGWFLVRRRHSGRNEHPQRVSGLESSSAFKAVFTQPEQKILLIIQILF